MLNGFSFAQTEDRPAVPGSMSRQRLVRVYRYRVSHLTEQWQIIMRVAVEPASGQIMAGFRQPLVQSHHLALLKTGNTNRTAGITPGNQLRLGGQQVGNAK